MGKKYQIGHIYKLFWTNCEHFYIGQTIDSNDRYSHHLRSLERGRHGNKRLQNVFNKWGVPSIEILDGSLKKHLNSLEQFYIDNNFGNSFCCNLCPTASSTQGYKHSEEVKKIVGELSKKKVYTEEYRNRLSQGQLNRTDTNRKGKKWSAEDKIEQSRKLTGRKKTDIHKRNIGLAHTGGKSYRALIIIDINTGVFYECLKEAAAYNNIFRDTLSYQLKRNQHRCLKYA